MINSIGPVWEGNQVWLILGGGAAFAAWPYLYVVSFSGLYIPVFIVLFSLILRPVGFKFRSKIDNPTWKTIWDSALFIGSFIPALVLGIGVGNFLLGGFPFHFDADLRMVYTGSFWQLFNIGGLTWGLAFVALFIRHGGYFLTLKTEGTLQKKAQDIAYVANILFIVFLVLGVFLTLHKGSTLYSNLVDYNAPSNPTLKNPIALAHAGWLTNISVNGLQGLWILYALPLLLAASALLLMISKNKVVAFIGSSVNILGLIGTFGWATFPFMLPSSSMPHHSLLIWDSSSSRLTLFLSLIHI
jgi:cytochrome d ubiquinol oxidase subunit II